MIRETLEWFAPAEKLPDDDTIVLVKVKGQDEPVWPGWYDGETWVVADGFEVDPGDLLLWAQMPAGEATP